MYFFGVGLMMCRRILATMEGGRVADDFPCMNDKSYFKHSSYQELRFSIPTSTAKSRDDGVILIGRFVVSSLEAILSLLHVSCVVTAFNALLLTNPVDFT